jgi:hypothetical protein
MTGICLTLHLVCFRSRKRVVMKTGTARYAKHYEIAAYGESAVRWGYNHWWGRTFLLGFSADTFKNLGRTTESDVISGWGMASGIFDALNLKARVDNRCRSGAGGPTLEIFGFADTPWARLCYGKKWLTKKLTGFNKEVRYQVHQSPDGRHRSDSFKIDPLSYGCFCWWTLSESPSLLNRHS